MPTELRIIRQHWDVLEAHLLAADGFEHAAVLLCGGLRTQSGSILLVREVVRLEGADLLSSGELHLSLSPVILARITKRARMTGGTVVMCHSHPFGGPVAASPLDLETERELCGWPGSRNGPTGGGSPGIAPAILSRGRGRLRRSTR